MRGNILVQAGTMLSTPGLLADWDGNIYVAARSLETTEQMFRTPGGDYGRGCSLQRAGGVEPVGGFTRV